MTALEFLSQFPNQAEYSRKSIVVLFAYYLRRYRGLPEFEPTDVRSCFEGSLLKVPSDLGVLLRDLSKGRDARLLRSNGGRYGLSIHGLKEVESVLPPSPATAVALGNFLEAAIPHLKRTIAQVTDPQRREFLAEAISCLGVQARRATVVMVWLAAIDHMYEYVVSKKLADFNAALKLRTDRASKVTVTTRDDFGDIKESVFIEVCRSASIITNDVRKILDERLGFRNSCAHPAAIAIGDAKIVSFIEDLVDNVIAKFQP